MYFSSQAERSTCPLLPFIAEKKQVRSVKKMMRVKNKHIKFRELKAREIELSGVNVIEFNDFLENHGATEILNCALQLENLYQETNTNILPFQQRKEEKFKCITMLI